MFFNLRKLFGIETFPHLFSPCGIRIFFNFTSYKIKRRKINNRWKKKARGNKASHFLDNNRGFSSMRSFPVSTDTTYMIMSVKNHSLWFLLQMLNYSKFRGKLFYWIYTLISKPRCLFISLSFNSSETESILGDVIKSEKAISLRRVFVWSA